jgi:hypothetical protein
LRLSGQTKWHNGSRSWGGQGPERDAREHRADICLV